MSLYGNFLVPLVEYGTQFRNEHIEKITSYSGGVTLDNKYYDLLQQEHLKNRYYNLELFIKLMYSVKLAEGYSEDGIVELINDLIFVNSFSKKDESKLVETIIEQIRNEHKL